MLTRMDDCKESLTIRSERGAEYNLEGELAPGMGCGYNLLVTWLRQGAVLTG